MRILFISSTRIGDAVLSTGLLDHLMRTHPDARFTMVCGRVAEGVFRRMPGLDRLIAVEKRPYSLHWLDIWGQLATTRWDLVVDLRASAIAWLLIKALVGLRVSPQEEIEGLDIHEHGNEAYHGFVMVRNE